jgi:hypothetical protein
MNPQRGRMLYLSLMTISIMLLAASATLLTLRLTTKNYNYNLFASVCQIGASLCLIWALFLKMRLDRKKSQ